MKRRFTNEEKRQFIVRYEDGETAQKIYTEIGVSKSTFYSWLNDYRTRKSKTNTQYTAKEVLELRANNQKLRDKLEILSIVNCTGHSDLQLKLIEMEKLSGKYSVYTLCEALNVARGTYYNHIKRNKKQMKDVIIRRIDLKRLIEEIFNESEQRFGSRKIKSILKDKGHIVSPKLIQDLMAEMNLQPIGMNSKKEYRKMILGEKRVNVLNKNFSADTPNTVWCSDFTEFSIGKFRLYVLVIMDLFSRKIVGYKIVPTPTTYSLTSTMKKALKERNVDTSKLLFHSDQGSQYTSYTFRKLMKDLKITQSFSQKGTPTHNSVIEAFMGNFKKEELYRRYIEKESDFFESADRYIDFYNNKRPHQTLNFKIPTLFELEFEQKNNK